MLNCCPALVRLEEADLHTTELSSDQTSAVLQRIAVSQDIKLVKLSIWSNDMATVPSDTLSRAAEKLEDLSLFITNLTTDQVNGLLSRIVESGQLKLKSLDICDNDLSSVSTQVLVDAISRLEGINLYNTKLTQDQLEGITKTVAECEVLKLNNIDLRYNNLSSLAPDILSLSAVRLKRISLEESQMTLDQSVALLTRISDSPDENLNLKQLEMGKNDLSQVPRDLIAQSILRLEDVSLKESQLTAEQIKSIFLAISDSKELRLSSIDLREADLSSVPEDVLLRVKSRVTWLYLTEESPESHRIIYRKARHGQEV